MARIRSIKPQFFRHRRLYLGEVESGLPLRVAFAGLWTCADREGRFRWEPEELKLDCLPFDQIDFSRVLEALCERGFIFHYVLEDREFGVIPGFKDHQVINIREAKSQLPEPPAGTHVHARAGTSPSVHEPRGVNVPETLRLTIIARDKACLRCSSTQDLTVDHIFPQSIGGTHAITNLRTLCRSCNSRRPVAGQALIDDLAADGLTLSDMQRMCMHVQDKGERKGKEGKGAGKEGEGKENIRADALDDDWPSDAFDQLWKAFPKRTDKIAAEKKLATIRKSKIVTFADLMAGVHRYAGAVVNTDPQYIKNPAAWLNAGRWADEVQPGANNGQRLNGFHSNSSAGPAPTRDASVIAGMGRALDRRRADRAAANGNGELRGHPDAARTDAAERKPEAGDDGPSGQPALVPAGHAGQ